MIKTALRLFSYVFSGGLGLFQMGLALVAMLSGEHNLKLDLYPFQGKDLTHFLLALGGASVLGTWGGIKGNALRFLLPITGALQSWFLVKNQMMGPQAFDGLLNWETSVSAAGGSLLSLVGSVLQLAKRKRS